jgi:hypothetical protein
MEERQSIKVANCDLGTKTLWNLPFRRAASPPSYWLEMHLEKNKRRLPGIANTKQGEQHSVSHDHFIYYHQLHLIGT